MSFACRFAVRASALLLLALSDGVQAQDESFDVILIKKLDAGAQTEDASFVSIMEDAVERWVEPAGKVLVFYDQELPKGLEQRAEYFRSRGLLYSLRVRFVKYGDNAVVTFVIAQTNAAAEAGLPPLSEFRHSTALLPTAHEALPKLESDLKLFIVPTLKFYMQSAEGTRVLADCIRPELDEPRTRRASKHITRLYPRHMAVQSAERGMLVQGLTEAQIDYICLRRDDEATAAARYDRMSDNPSIRKLYDHVVFGDLDIDAKRVYLTWEDRDGAETLRTIPVAQADFDGKAIELATRILELIPAP